MIRNTLK